MRPGRRPQAGPTDLAQTDITALVATYSPLLFRVAHSVLRSRPEAEDVVQNTFLRVLQHQRKPQPIVRQTVLQGTSFLTAGKPGTLDVAGTTRRMEISVVMDRSPNPRSFASG